MGDFSVRNLKQKLIKVFYNGVPKSIQSTRGDKTWYVASWKSIDTMFNFVVLTVLWFWLKNYMGERENNILLIKLVLFLYIVIEILKPFKFYQTKLTFLIMKSSMTINLIGIVLTFPIINSSLFNGWIRIIYWLISRYNLGSSLVESIAFILFIYILVKLIFQLPLRKTEVLSQREIVYYEKVANHFMTMLFGVMLVEGVVKLTEMFCRCNLGNTILRVLLISLLVTLCLCLCLCAFSNKTVARLVNVFAIWIAITFGIIEIMVILNQPIYTLTLKDVVIMLLSVCVFLVMFIILEKTLIMRYIIKMDDFYRARNEKFVLIVIMLIVSSTAPPSLFFYFEEARAFAVLSIYLTLLFLILRTSFKKFLALVSLAMLLIPLKIYSGVIHGFIPFLKDDTVLSVYEFIILFVLNLFLLIYYFQEDFHTSYNEEIFNQSIYESCLLLEIKKKTTEVDRINLMRVIDRIEVDVVKKKYALNTQEFQEIKQKYWIHYYFGMFKSVVYNLKFSEKVMYEEFLKLVETTKGISIIQVDCESNCESIRKLKKLYHIEEEKYKIAEWSEYKINEFIESLFEFEQIDEYSKKNKEIISKKMKKICIKMKQNVQFN